MRDPGPDPPASDPARRDAPIRLVIAEHPEVALGFLDRLFRLEDNFLLLMRCHNVEETLQALRTLRPHVLVLSARGDDRAALVLLSRIEEEGLATRVVLLVSGVGEGWLLEAIHLGVQGVVSEEQAPEMLAEAVREVHAGGHWLRRGLGSRALKELLERETGLRGAARVLSSRELEIVRLVARGMRNRAIGDKLFISESSVERHLDNIYDKLRVHGRLELALYAQEKGLI